MNFNDSKEANLLIRLQIKPKLAMHNISNSLMKIPLNCK